MPNIFCFGYGQVAKSYVNHLSKKNTKINLAYTSREIENKKNENSYKIFRLDENSYDDEIIKELYNADFILISIPPVNGEDIVIKHFSEKFKKLRTKCITYLSATSVYGNHDGEWVTEESSTEPKSENGIKRLKAEKNWISLCKNLNLPIQIFRLSGIYSSHNNILKRLKIGTAKIINKKNHFFSRIHLDDIANILIKSMSNFRSGEIFNISDDRPASNEEITLYAAGLMNIEIPERINEENIENKMLKDFYKDSKKVSNEKMKNFFDYKLKFPSYVEGLKYIRDNST